MTELTAGSMRGERVLIVGGLGFIGSNLARTCLDLGARVTIYDCLEPYSGGNMANVTDISGDANIILNDIRNLDGVGAAIRNQTLVFNCAGVTSHSESMRDPYLNVDVNCRGVINVLEAGRRYNHDVKIVHVGTSTQIGRMQEEPIDEHHSEFPLDIYSANKVVGEKYTLIYGQAYGMRTAVVRLANNFGPRACIRTPEFGFMNYFIGLAMQGKEISIFGDGQQQRNISYVSDSVAALLTVARSEQANGQVFFATADQQVTVSRVAEAIVDVIGGSVRYVEWPRDRAAIEIGDAVITNTKLRTALDWSPACTLEQGLSQTRDYFANRLTEYLR